MVHGHCFSGGPRWRNIEELKNPIEACKWVQLLFPLPERLDPSNDEELVPKTPTPKNNLCETRPTVRGICQPSSIRFHSIARNQAPK